jgi:hypothetical protein
MLEKDKEFYNDIKGPRILQCWNGAKNATMLERGREFYNARKGSRIQQC